MYKLCSGHYNCCTMNVTKSNRACILACFVGALIVISQIYGSIYSHMRNINIIQNGIFSNNIWKGRNYDDHSKDGKNFNDFVSDHYLNNSVHSSYRNYGIQNEDDRIGGIRQILPIKGNLLVWGPGSCSFSWYNITSGKVVLLGDDSAMRKEAKQLDARPKQKYHFLEAYQVHYKVNTVKTFAKYVNHSEIWHELDLCDQLPESVTQTPWHVIIIDAPHGCCGTGSGRYQSIYTSWKLAKIGTHIFVEDFESKDERDFSVNVFGEPQDVLKLRNREFSKAGNQAHFIINSKNNYKPNASSKRKQNESVRKKMKSVRKNDNLKHNWSLLLTVNNGFFDFFNNWRLHFIKLNISLPVYIIAEDNIVYNKLTHIENSDFKLQRSEYISINTTVEYDSILYKQMVSSRPAYILSFIQKGIDIIYSDMDSVWLKNPLPYLTGNFDVWGQVDFEPMNIFCTGFLAIKSNKSTYRLVKRWHRDLKKTPNLNQPVFNRLLKLSSLKLNALDSKFFPSGELYFEKFSEEERARAVVVHNNWIIGHENKLQRFRKMNLWLNQTIA